MEDQQSTANRSELWNISIKDIFFKYLRFLPLIALSVALALLGAYIYLRYSTEIYSVRGTLIIKNDKKTGREDRLEDLFSPSSNINVQNEIEVLKSRPLMTRVVRALNLQTSYFAIGKFKSTNIYKSAPFSFDIFELADSSKSFSFKINFKTDTSFQIGEGSSSFGIGQLFQNAKGVFRIAADDRPSLAGREFLVRWQTRESLSSSLAAAISVQSKRIGTGLLSISMETPNPQMGADIVNQLMIEYSMRSVESKNLTAKQTLEFIDDRMNKLKREVDSIARIRLDYQQKNDLIDVEVQSLNYFTVVTENDKALNLQKEKLNVAEIIDTYLRDKNKEHETFKLVPSSLGLEDITLTELVQAYNLAQLERRSLLDGGTPPSNPLIRQKEGQIEEIRQRTLENISNIKSAIQVQIDDLREKTNTAQSQIRQLPEKTRNLLEIDRSLEGKQTLYKYLSEKREETAISQASNVPDSDILDAALAPARPIKPNRTTVQLLALVLGLGVPALFILLLELLNDKITTRADIEKVTQAPVLGEVGHSYSMGTSLVVKNTDRSMLGEQFRIIRSNLQYVVTRIEKPVILVTSSFSGEGKSFISTNMGAVMALAGKKTIVLEFDIRKPKIMSGLKLQKNNNGITNYLLGKASIDDLPVLVPGHDNLYILPCGPVPPNPAELLLESKVAELFVYLKKQFDVIIIDTAPVGMVSDTMTLSKFADCTLYIVRQGHTLKKQVFLIDEFYREGKLPKISIVINDVKIKPGYGYYGYGRYGYGYGYGQGYYEEEPTRPKRFSDKIARLLGPVFVWRRTRRK